MAEDLSKRGKVGDVYRSGSYKKQKAAGRKTVGLSARQVAGGSRVGRAGKKAISKSEAKAATKNVIDISTTSWRSASERTGPRAKGGIVVGQDGKPITGQVKLASGKIATYVRGKRVVSGGKGGSAGRGGNGGGNSTSRSTSRSKIPTTRVSPSRRDEGAKPKTYFKPGASPSQRGEGAKPKTYFKPGASPSQRGEGGGKTKSPNGAKWYQPGGGGLVGKASPFSGNPEPKGSRPNGKPWWRSGGGGLIGPNSPFAGNGKSQGGPKKGDIRPIGGYGGYEQWNGSRWVKKK